MSFLNAGRALTKFALDWTRSKPEELMQAILDARPFNRTITERDMQFQEGKLRQLYITYYPPVCEDTGDCDDTVCDSGTKIEPHQMYFKLSQCTASAVYTLAKDDIRLVDGSWDFSDHAKMQMASVMPTVRHKMAVEMAALLVSNVGILPNGNASQLLPFVSQGTAVAQPKGMWEIERTFHDSGYSNPFIVGGPAVWEWKKSTEIGGLSAEGQYLDRMRRDQLYYDNLVNTTFNNNQENIIAFDPQMLKFIAFNEHAGLFRTQKYTIDDLTSMFIMGSPTRIEGVMPDQFTGLLWDLDIKYSDELNDCRGGWKFQVRLNWDIFFMPPQVCNVQGVTGIFHFTTCPQLEATCETGSVITPADEATYSADASGLSYPLLLQKLVIAGVTTYPSQNEPVSVANLTALVAQLNANAPAPLEFSVNGTDIEYEGYVGIEVEINGTTTLTFTV